MRGAIPVDESIAIAKQIAEGLEEAHEHGIIHRDLKPANVKVTPDGKVKILDFGLAKALKGDPSSAAVNSRVSHSPTMSRHMTEAGVIMGTAAYMSPEQARGKAVDKRADALRSTRRAGRFLEPAWSHRFCPRRLWRLGDWRAGLSDQPKP